MHVDSVCMRLHPLSGLRQTVCPVIHFTHFTFLFIAILTQFDQQSDYFPLCQPAQLCNAGNSHAAIKPGLAGRLRGQEDGAGSHERHSLC